MKNYNVALSEEQIKTRKLHGSSLLNLMKYYRKNSEFMRPFVKNGMTTLLGNYILVGKCILTVRYFQKPKLLSYNEFENKLLHNIC